MEQLTIQPLRVTSVPELATQIRNTFNLNQAPWDNMDDYLLYLAFVPGCEKQSGKLRIKFGTCDHQTLEFYGDTVLYTITSILFLDRFGIKTVPTAGILTRLKNYLTQNRTLTDIMINKDACKFVRSKRPIVIKTEDKPFHNVCADSFEALLGAMFFHLWYLKKQPWVEPITKWVVENTEIPQLMNTFLENQKLAKKTGPLIVDPQTPIQDIYRSLGWIYGSPLKLKDQFRLLGYPQGKTEIIGVGDDAQSAILNGLTYLLQNGYIIYQQATPKHFRR